MNIVDIYVMFLYFEGLLFVIGEVMVIENVVIVIDCGGICEVIGDNGFFVLIWNSEVLVNVML